MDLMVTRRPRENRVRPAVARFGCMWDSTSLPVLCLPGLLESRAAKFRNPKMLRSRIFRARHGAQTTGRLADSPSAANDAGMFR
jgi:hypothetical protein